MSRGKVFAVSLASVLSVSALVTGCGSGNASNSSNNASNSSNNTSKSKGQNPVTINITMQDGGNAYAQSLKPNDPYFQEMSKLFSNYAGQSYQIKPTMMNHALYEQKLETLFAAGNIPSLLWTRGMTDPLIAKGVGDGVFMPLNSLIDKYGPNLKKAIPQSVWNNPAVSKNGKIYGIPKMLAAPQGSNVILYREDWLKKFGMQPPKTLNDYLQYFADVKKMNPNIIPYGVRKGLAYSTSFFGYFGVFPSDWQWINGQFIPDIINPKMKQAIAFYKKLYDKGYVNKNMFTMTGAQWDQDIHAGKIAMWQHSAMDLVNDDHHSEFKDPNAVVAALPGPENSSGKANLTPAGRGFSAVWMISSKSKEAAAAIKLFNWAYSNDKAKNTFFSYGIKGVNYTVKNGKVQWSATSTANTTKHVRAFYQTMINLGGDARLSPQVVSQSKYAKLVDQAETYAKEDNFTNQALYMPVLPIYKTNPQLLGAKDGTLFMDMFAKVVTGQEPLDSGFANFVKQWKAQGGNQAIQQGTAWYKSSHNQK